MIVDIIYVVNISLFKTKDNTVITSNCYGPEAGIIPLQRMDAASKLFYILLGRNGI